MEGSHPKHPKKGLQVPREGGTGVAWEDPRRSSLEDTTGTPEPGLDTTPVPRASTGRRLRIAEAGWGVHSISGCGPALGPWCSNLLIQIVYI